MADGIFFENQNKIFDKLKADLNKYSEDLVKQIDAEIYASVEEMATKAKQKAPATPSGRLRASIKAEKDPNSKLAYDLVAKVRYAAYVEFGTGPFAKEYVPSLDSEWQEYAATFKTSKPGHTPAQPFFYPSVREVFPQMVKRIEDLIKG
jgi:HK97 gp10 family phage protein